MIPFGGLDRLLEQLHHPLWPDSLPPPHQRRRVQRENVLKILEPAEVLPVRIFDELLDRTFVADVVGVLEVVQSDQQPDRQARSTGRLAIERAELPLENRPVDLAGQLEQRVPGVSGKTHQAAEEGCPSPSAAVRVFQHPAKDFLYTSQSCPRNRAGMFCQSAHQQ